MSLTISAPCMSQVSAACDLSSYPSHYLTNMVSFPPNSLSKPQPSLQCLLDSHLPEGLSPEAHSCLHLAWVHWHPAPCLALIPARAKFCLHCNFQAQRPTHPPVCPLRCWSQWGWLFSPTVGLNLVGKGMLSFSVCVPRNPLQIKEPSFPSLNAEHP